MSNVYNAYPELVEMEYMPTSILMPDAEAHIKKMTIPAAVKAGVYTMFRFESNNGKKGVNNNYAGIQAETRWPDQFTDLMAGTVVKKENDYVRNGVPHKGAIRRFVAFKSVDGCLAMLADRVQSRGLYVGGMTHLITRISVHTPEDFAVAYKREWVTGEPRYIPTEKEIKDLAGTYRQGLRLFS